MADLDIAPAPLRRCSKCGEHKPATREFFGRSKDGRGVERWHSWCKGCGAAARKERYQHDLEAGRARARAYYHENPEKRAQYARAYYLKNHDREKAKALVRRNANRGKAVADSQKWRQDLRAELIVAYGGVCTCCGESEPRFLTLEHINRDGAEHRRRVGAGTQLYMSLRRKGWPKEGLTLLCWNCQMASWFYGVCPHKEREAERRESPA